MSQAAGAEPTIDATLAALADPVRRQIVELLARRPMRPGDLARETGTTPSSMSKHLRVLRQRGLVTESHPRFDARVRVYSLRSARMAELRAWLDAAEQAWTQQLTAFADFVGEAEAGGEAG